MVYLYVNKKATVLFKQLRNSLKLGRPLKNEEHAFFKNLGGKIMLGAPKRCLTRSCPCILVPRSLRAIRSHDAWEWTLAMDAALSHCSVLRLMSRNLVMSASQLPHLHSQSIPMNSFELPVPSLHFNDGKRDAFWFEREYSSLIWGWVNRGYLPFCSVQDCTNPKWSFSALKTIA